MKNKILSDEELSNLREKHRELKIKREADKIKSVYLSGIGWTNKDISQALLLDEDTISNYFKKYKSSGIPGLLDDNYSGGASYLGEKEIYKLKLYLEENLFRNTGEAIKYIKDTFQVEYGNRGMANLLNSIGYVYKKTKTIPGKANPELQQEFIEKYEELVENKGNNPIYFLDATHPQHNVENGYAWIEKSFDWIIPSNTGRKRLNINGALNIETKDSVFLFEEKINVESVLRIFKELENRNPDADCIYVICDNASYHHSRIAKEYVEKSRIKMVFLPPYSPNLNIIERLWKFFKKKVVSYYYSEFSEFKMACADFFQNLHGPCCQNNLIQP